MAAEGSVVQPKQVPDIAFVASGWDVAEPSTSRPVRVSFPCNGVFFSFSRDIELVQAKKLEENTRTTAVHRHCVHVRSVLTRSMLETCVSDT